MLLLLLLLLFLIETEGDMSDRLRKTNWGPDQPFSLRLLYKIHTALQASYQVITQWFLFISTGVAMLLRVCKCTTSHHPELRMSLVKGF